MKKHLGIPGANDYLMVHKAENSGLPFWSILDEKGENLGCPAIKDEVTDFIAILKRTSKLSDEQLAIISEMFWSPCMGAVS